MTYYILQRRGVSEPGKLKVAIVEAKSPAHARVQVADHTKDNDWGDDFFTSCAVIRPTYVYGGQK